MEVFYDSSIAGALIGIVLPIVVQFGKLIGLKAKQSLALFCVAIAFGVGVFQSVQAHKIDIPSMGLAGFASLGLAVSLYEWGLKHLYSKIDKHIARSSKKDELTMNDQTEAHEI